MTSRKRFERFIKHNFPAFEDSMHIPVAFPASWAAWSARDAEVKRLVEALRASQTWLYGHHNREGQQARLAANAAILEEYADV